MTVSDLNAEGTFSDIVGYRTTAAQITNEAHVVGEVGTYQIELVERPSQASDHAVTITGYTETDSESPAALEFFVNYPIGRLTFNAAASGASVAVSYFGQGTLIRNEHFNNLYDEVALLRRRSLTAMNITIASQTQSVVRYRPDDDEIDFPVLTFNVLSDMDNESVYAYVTAAEPNIALVDGSVVYVVPTDADGGTLDVEVATTAAYKALSTATIFLAYRTGDVCVLWNGDVLNGYSEHVVGETPDRVVSERLTSRELKYIACAGDSITAFGYNGYERDWRGAYPNLLQELLSMSPSCWGLTVANKGRSGDTSTTLAARYYTDQDSASLSHIGRVNEKIITGIIDTMANGAVTITCEKHGLAVGDTIHILGATGTGSVNINASHIVSAVDDDDTFDLTVVGDDAWSVSITSAYIYNKPDLVTIFVGINDLLNKAVGLGNDFTNYIQNLETVIGYIRADGAIPLLMSFPTCSQSCAASGAFFAAADQATADAYTDTWNAAIKRLAQREKVHFFDLAEYLGPMFDKADTPVMINDAFIAEPGGEVVHLSFAGHQKAATGLARYITSQVLSGGSAGATDTTFIPYTSSDVSLTTPGGSSTFAEATLLFVDRAVEEAVAGSDQETGYVRDVIPSGVYAGSTATRYRVEIDGTGTPDTFKWSSDNGSTWTDTTVNITGAAQLLEEGIYITFANTTGYTSGDAWEFEPFGDQVYHLGYMNYVNGETTDQEVVTLDFYGSGIALVCRTGNYGVLEITLDGVTDTVDLYRGNVLEPSFQELATPWSRRGLDGREHSLSIVLKGTVTAPATVIGLDFIGFLVEQSVIWRDSSSVKAAVVGAGDVTGPGGGSTDNAVARFDGVGGVTLLDSAVIIADGGNTTIVNTTNDANPAILELTKQRVAGACNVSDIVGRVSFQGKSDAAVMRELATISTKYTRINNTTESGLLQVYVMSTGTQRKFVEFGQNGTIFNQDGDATLHVRFEGDTDANLMYMKASTDKIGIGTDAPETKLHIMEAGSVDAIVTIEAGTTEKAGQLILKANDTAANTAGETVGDILFKGLNAAGTPAVATYATIGARAAVNTAGSEAGYIVLAASRVGAADVASVTIGKVESAVSTIVVNDEGSNVDFRVEGDTTASLFFCDASTDRVGVGTNAPSETVDIVGNLEVNGQIVTPPSTLTSTANALSPDADNSNVFHHTLTENTTVGVIAHAIAGATYLFYLKQDASSAFSVSWNAAYLFPGGTDHTMSAGNNAVDVVSCYAFSDTSFCCTFAKAFS